MNACAQLVASPSPQFQVAICTSVLPVPWEGGDISVEERDQNYVVPEPTEDDEDLEEAMENLQEDFFHFVPSQPRMGEAGPGPSTVASTQQVQGRVLDDDEDTRVERNTQLMERARYGRWRANVYEPFASEMDWRIADWMIKDNPGHKVFDRLLAIPG
ncbi:hypothetical protein B0H21DRAFT_711252, partial [Amylocystis lapponica]